MSTGHANYALVTGKPLNFKNNEFKERKSLAEELGELLKRELPVELNPGFNIGMIGYKISEKGEKNLLIVISGQDKLASNSIQEKLTEIASSTKWRAIEKKYAKKLGKIAIANQKHGNTAKKYGYLEQRRYPAIIKGPVDKKAGQHAYFFSEGPPSKILSPTEKELTLSLKDMEEFIRIMKIPGQSIKDKEKLYEIIRKSPQYTTTFVDYCCSEPFLAAEREKLILKNDYFEDIGENHFGVRFDVNNGNPSNFEAIDRPACNECYMRFKEKLKDRTPDQSFYYSPIDPPSPNKWSTMDSLREEKKSIDENIEYKSYEYYMERAKKYLAIKMNKPEFAKICYSAAISQLRKKISSLHPEEEQEEQKLKDALAKCYLTRATILYENEHSLNNLNSDDLVAVKDLSIALELDAKITISGKLKKLQLNVINYVTSETKELLKELKKGDLSDMYDSKTEQIHKRIIHLQVIKGAKNSPLEKLQKEIAEYDLTQLKIIIENLSNPEIPGYQNFLYRDQLYKRALYCLETGKAYNNKLSNEIEQLESQLKELRSNDLKAKFVEFNNKKSMQLVSSLDEKKSFFDFQFEHTKFHINLIYNHDSTKYEEAKESLKALMPEEETENILKKLPGDLGSIESEEIIQYCLKISKIMLSSLEDLPEQLTPYKEKLFELLFFSAKKVEKSADFTKAGELFHAASFFCPNTDSVGKIYDNPCYRWYKSSLNRDHESISEEIFLNFFNQEKGFFSKKELGNIIPYELLQKFSLNSNYLDSNVGSSLSDSNLTLAHKFPDLEKMKSYFLRKDFSVDKFMNSLEQKYHLTNLSKMFYIEILIDYGNFILSEKNSKDLQEISEKVKSLGQLKKNIEKGIINTDANLMSLISVNNKKMPGILSQRLGVNRISENDIQAKLRHLENEFVSLRLREEYFIDIKSTWSELPNKEIERHINSILNHTNGLISALNDYQEKGNDYLILNLTARLQILFSVRSELLAERSLYEKKIEKNKIENNKEKKIFSGKDLAKKDKKSENPKSQGRLSSSSDSYLQSVDYTRGSPFAEKIKSASNLSSDPNSFIAKIGAPQKSAMIKTPSIEFAELLKEANSLISGLYPENVTSAAAIEAREQLKKMKPINIEALRKWIEDMNRISEQQKKQWSPTNIK